MNRGTTFYLKTGLAILLVCILAGYSYYQSRNIRSGPRISIDTPLDGALVTTGTIDIKGKAENVSEITLDDNPIFVDESGAFSEKRAVLPGFNIFQVKVKDKFARVVSKNIQIVYRPATDAPVIQ